MNALGAILMWCVFGLCVGLIARALYPGRQAMGLGMTIVLGIVGSLVGGFISWAFTGGPDQHPLQGGGWIMSILGGLIVVWASLHFGSRRTTPM